MAIIKTKDRDVEVPDRDRVEIPLRHQMMSCLCEVCLDYATIDGWDPREFGDRACTICRNRLLEAGLVEP